MYNSTHLIEKWKPVLEHEGLSPIKDAYKREVTAILLENTYNEIQKGRGIQVQLQETAPTMNTDGGVTYGTTGTLKGFDSVLLGMVRRQAPNNMAFDWCAVQPMKTPVSMIFALRSRYVDDVHMADWSEALYNEAVTDFSGTGDHAADLAAAMFPLADRGTDLDSGTGMTTSAAEALDGTSWPEMGISIERVTVTAVSRALKARWSTELQQDLQAVHGENAENILANLLSVEMLAEQNRELVRTLYRIAKAGAAYGTNAAGIFDLDIDSGGRWFKEKVIGLMYQIDREANAIGKETRRGKGNLVVTSSDVAAALNMAGLVDNAGLKDSLQVDDTGNTYCGVLNGKYDLYIDPYFNASSTAQFVLVGYKGSAAVDAGLFFCPYVPLQMTQAIDPASLQPVMGFKTRYGLVANPFAAVEGQSGLTAGQNLYYRLFQVSNII